VPWHSIMKGPSFTSLSHGRDHLIHPHDDELELYRMDRLPDGHSSFIRSHLSECNFCAIKFRRLNKQDQTTNKSEVRERRRHVRVPTDRPASIRVVHASLKPLACRVFDASGGGLKLKVSIPLEPGTLVHVRLAKTFIMAEVRYCLRKGREFHVGLETKDVFEIPGTEGSSSLV